MNEFANSIVGAMLSICALILILTFAIILEESAKELYWRAKLKLYQNKIARKLK